MRSVRLFFFLWLAAGAAQAADSAETTVKALDDQERIAALARDVPALEKLWSEDMTVNAPNNRVVAGKKAVLDMFVRAGIIDFSTFERSYEHVKGDTWRLYWRHANVIPGS